MFLNVVNSLSEKKFTYLLTYLLWKMKIIEQNDAHNNIN